MTALIQQTRSTRPGSRARLRATDLFVADRASIDDGQGSRDVVVVSCAGGVPVDEARRALRAVRDAHAAIRHPRVPRLVGDDVDGDAPWLALDCPAVCDASTVIGRLAEGSSPLPYGGADAFIVSLRDALRAGHRCGHFLGRFSPHNVWFAADGTWWLTGFGRNFPLEVRGAPVDVTVPSFMAPELMGGGAPSATADFVALILFMRSVIAYVDVPERLASLLRGEVSLEDSVLALRLMQFEQRVVGALPARRASIEEAIAISDDVRRELGVVLDEEAFRAHVQRLLAGVDVAAATAVAKDASTVHGPDGVVRLGRAPRRILLALQAARARGATLTVDEVAAAGWPDERLVHDSARTRAYVAIRHLRQAGLQIERFDGGYRLGGALAVIDT